MDDHAFAREARKLLECTTNEEALSTLAVIVEKIPKGGGTGFPSDEELSGAGTRVDPQDFPEEIR